MAQELPDEIQELLTELRDEARHAFIQEMRAYKEGKIQGIGEALNIEFPFREFMEGTVTVDELSMPGTSLPFELDRETFVNGLGGDSEIITEIHEYTCEECGYDRAIVKRDTFHNLYHEAKCNACGHIEGINTPVTEELNQNL